NLWRERTSLSPRPKRPRSGEDLQAARRNFVAANGLKSTRTNGTSPPQTTTREATHARCWRPSRPRSVQKIIQGYSTSGVVHYPRLARRCRFVVRRAARLCGSPRRTEVEQMKGNTMKLITLSLIAVA